MSSRNWFSCAVSALLGELVALLDADDPLVPMLDDDPLVVEPLVGDPEVPDVPLVDPELPAPEVPLVEPLVDPDGSEIGIHADDF